MHEAIVHNMISLLECGAFGTVNGETYTAERQQQGTDASAPVVAMSPHKWRKLAIIAETMGVLPYIARGAEMMKGEKYLSPTLFTVLDDPDKKLDITDLNVANVQLYNHWTSKRFEEVHEEEMNSQSISEETLNLLDIIIANADEIITRDVSVEGIIALGYYIRHNKEKIDFDKLGDWLRRIGMVRMASLQGSILIDSMHFSDEELPFVVKPYRKAGKLFMKSLTKALGKHSCSTSVRMDVAMLETISHRFMSAISLVTDVEE